MFYLTKNFLYSYGPNKTTFFVRSITLAVAWENSLHFATERLQEFHTWFDEVCLPRYWACFWLVEANFPRSRTNQKHFPDLASDTSYKYAISALVPRTSFRGETSAKQRNNGWFLRLLSQGHIVTEPKRIFYWSRLQIWWHHLYKDLSHTTPVIFARADYGLVGWFPGGARRLTKSVANTPFPHSAPRWANTKKWGQGSGR